MIFCKINRITFFTHNITLSIIYAPIVLSPESLLLVLVYLFKSIFNVFIKKKKEKYLLSLCEKERKRNLATNF